MLMISTYSNIVPLDQILLWYLKSILTRIILISNVHDNINLLVWDFEGKTWRRFHCRYKWPWNTRE